MELLHSKYIIDGQPMDCSPAQMLEEIGCALPFVDGCSSDRVLTDETPDPAPGGHAVDPSLIGEYLQKVKAARLSFPFAFAAQHTRSRMEGALLEHLWHKGHFTLEDIALKAEWTWSEKGLGSIAAFHHSVEAACALAEDLGVQLEEASFREGEPGVSFCAQGGSPLEEHCVSDTFVDDPQSWIVYVPFESSDYRLGGGLLAKALGFGGGQAPECDDPDYFMDCYEVVREFVEDGVVLAGRTVLEGGLMAASDAMSAGRTGAVLDLSSMKRALECDDVVRMLFAEVPGVLIQIRDDDFDYVDAELLLQDVLYFPLGHPTPGKADLHIKASPKTGIESILDSLMRQ